MSKIDIYIKNIISDIKSGLNETWYSIDGDIMIEYADGEHVIKFVVSNRW